MQKKSRLGGSGAASFNSPYAQLFDEELMVIAAGGLEVEAEPTN